PSGSHNLIDADGTNFPPGFRDGAITPDTIGPLQDNGGPTRTHALRPGSNAIGAVAGGCFDPRTGNALNRDQRADAPGLRPTRRPSHDHTSRRCSQWTFTDLSPAAARRGGAGRLVRLDVDGGGVRSPRRPGRRR